MSSTQAFGKDTDYTKLLQHDVEEEEKVLHLCHHSKKSAIAFRLINKFTPALLNTVIRCSSTEKVALEPPCKLDFVNSYKHAKRRGAKIFTHLPITIQFNILGLRVICSFNPTCWQTEPETCLSLLEKLDLVML
jgi:hypothetical protein